MDSMVQDLTRITDSVITSKLINEILDLSKIEAGRLELFVTDFVDSVLDVMESVASRQVRRTATRSSSKERRSSATHAR